MSANKDQAKRLQIICDDGSTDDGCIIAEFSVADGTFSIDYMCEDGIEFSRPDAVALRDFINDALDD